ncbi:gamma-glutamyl-gamma-aminobutyrate hydrolase family protein [bacterium]|nr:gamma-glutamyl-gamma-aminobutyrate hydrolase family protein [bacterium]
MKIVAVSQRIDIYPDRNERRDALDQKMVSFVLEAGFYPMPVPNTLSPNRSQETVEPEALYCWLTTVNAQAILLSGGNDIGTCSDRDLTENGLLDYAAQKSMPVLGICRGMQFIGVQAGVELKNAVGHVRTRHILQGEISGEVNSFHDMALDKCPSDYSVLARSEDGEVEAIRHKNLPWEGWMWHPEREETFDSRDLERLRELIRY